MAQARREWALGAVEGTCGCCFFVILVGCAVVVVCWVSSMWSTLTGRFGWLTTYIRTHTRKTARLAAPPSSVAPAVGLLREVAGEALLSGAPGEGVGVLSGAWRECVCVSVLVLAGLDVASSYLESANK